MLYSHMSMNACLAPLCTMHGLAVTTVEGIGSTRTKLHAVQVNLILIGLMCGRGGAECTDNDIWMGIGHWARDTC